MNGRSVEQIQAELKTIFSEFPQVITIFKILVEQNTVNEQTLEANIFGERQFQYQLTLYDLDRYRSSKDKITEVFDLLRELGKLLNAQQTFTILRRLLQD